jgi:shikimate 5-dehydrogenase
LLHTYRFRSIGTDTRVYGLVGWPVGHSISPRVHNAGFDAVGFDAVYLPLPIPGARAAATERDERRDHAPTDVDDAFLSFKATLGELLDHPRFSLHRVSVTIPHKENLVRLARESGWSIDPAAERIGAANTLVAERAPDGRLAAARVLNTDAPAVAAAMRAAAGELRGRSVGVIGAGGVGRAAAYALGQADAIVTVYNRSRSRADVLVNDIAPWAPAGLAAADFSRLAEGRHDAWINCTPAGMAGGAAEHECPIPIATLRSAGPGSTVVVDTVYRPILTPLLKSAAECGHRTVPGVEIFVAQAEAQFNAWTGRDPPPGVFDRVARESLA